MDQAQLDIIRHIQRFYRTPSDGAPYPLSSRAVPYLHINRPVPEGSEISRLDFTHPRSIASSSLDLAESQLRGYDDEARRVPTTYEERGFTDTLVLPNSNSVVRLGPADPEFEAVEKNGVHIMSVEDYVSYVTDKIITGKDDVEDYVGLTLVQRSPQLADVDVYLARSNRQLSTKDVATLEGKLVSHVTQGFDFGRRCRNMGENPGDVRNGCWSIASKLKDHGLLRHKLQAYDQLMQHSTTIDQLVAQDRWKDGATLEAVDVTSQMDVVRNGLHNFAKNAAQGAPASAFGKQRQDLPKLADDDCAGMYWRAATYLIQQATATSNLGASTDVSHVAQMRHGVVSSASAAHHQNQRQNENQSQSMTPPQQPQAPAGTSSPGR